MIDPDKWEIADERRIRPGEGTFLPIWFLISACSGQTYARKAKNPDKLEPHQIMFTTVKWTSYQKFADVNDISKQIR